MDVLYAINGKYKNFFLASCISIAINNPNQSFNVHIIVSDFTTMDYNSCERVLSDHKNINFKFYPIEKFDINKYGIPDWRGTSVPNARLFFQEYLDLTKIDKLLYLDADTLVVGDLKDLFDYDGTINAVFDNNLKSYIEKKKLTRYFNSGVLLFDIQKWIDNKIEDRIIDYCLTNDIFSLRFPDQEILNFSANKYIEVLPFRYNINLYSKMKLIANIYYHGNKRQLNYETIVKELKTPVIYHLYGLGKIKPWTYNKTNPFNEIFDKYMYFVDKNFKKEQLEGIWKLLDEYEYLLYLTIITMDLLSEEKLYKVKEHINLLKHVQK